MGCAVRFVPVTVTSVTTWLFVALDAGGMTGWGEATLQGQEGAVAALARALPREITDTDLAHLPFQTLPQAALSSAIHQAHADLLAWRAGVPLSDHLGGACHRTVGVYANINRCTQDRSTSGIAASARRALAQGHTAIKIAPFDEVRADLGPAAMARAMQPGLARIAAVRDAIDDRRLMVDCHWRFDAQGAEAMIDACAPFGLYWIECPIVEAPDAIPTLKSLRARANATGTRLAGLETAILRAGFAPYVQAGAYDVMMPDVKYCGGPREMLAIAADLARAGVAFSPHNPGGPICHAHSLHLCATLPACDLLEIQFDETPMFNTLIDNALPPTRNGKAPLPRTPGLGVSLTRPVP